MCVKHKISDTPVLPFFKDTDTSGVFELHAFIMPKKDFELINRAAIAAFLFVYDNTKFMSPTFYQRQCGFSFSADML